MQGIIAFILIFFVVVTIHEFGHFIAAKRAGILCQEFAIGMGPKIFHKKIGETNFTIRLLPVGGYVKMPDNVFDFNNDMSVYDLKKGMKVSLKLDENDKVEKIVLDKSNDMDLLPLELKKFDLTEKLFVKYLRSHPYCEFLTQYSCSFRNYKMTKFVNSYYYKKY